MLQRELETELNKIYREMESWQEINKKPNYVITQKEIRRREEFLVLREILCKIDEAKKERDKDKEYYHLVMYYMMKLPVDYC